MILIKLIFIVQKTLKVLGKKLRFKDFFLICYFGKYFRQLPNSQNRY